MTEHNTMGSENTGVELGFESFMMLLEKGVPSDGSEVLDVNDRVVASDHHVADGTQAIWDTLKKHRYQLTITSIAGNGAEDNRFLWLGPNGCVSAQTVLTSDVSTPPSFVLKSHPLSSRYTVLFDLTDLTPIAEKDVTSTEAVQIEAETWENLVLEPGEERKHHKAQQDVAEALSAISQDMASDITQGLYEQVVVASEKHTDTGSAPIATVWVATPHGYVSFFSEPRKLFGSSHYLEPTEAWVLFMMASHQLPSAQQISAW